MTKKRPSPMLRRPRASILSSGAALAIPAIVAISGCANPESLGEAEQAAAGDPIGWFDGLIQIEHQLYAKGWACTPGLASAVSVELMAGGVVVGTIPADLPNEAAVANLCSSPTNHRFLVPISGAAVRDHGGQAMSVRVKGTSTFLGANTTFNLPTHMVLGNVDTASNIGGKVHVKGWACDIGVAQSIVVHVYAGAPAGQGGTLIAYGTAQQGSEAAVSTLCATSGVNHRFDLPLSEAAFAPWAGKPLYVYGIAVANPGANLLLARSGTVTMPPYFDIGWSAFKTRLVAGQTDVTIPDYLAVHLDEPALTLNQLEVQGKVTCNANDVDLSLHGLMVNGEKAVFQCGTEAAPYTGNFHLTLHGDNSEAGFPDTYGCMDSPAGTLIPTGPQAVIVKCGGRLDLHGDAPAPAPSRPGTWGRLAQTAEIGANQIVLRDAVDWQVGSTLAIASTSFDPAQTDQATITAVSADGKTITLDHALVNRHLGVKTTYSNGKAGADAWAWDLDQSAEVALLDRNIVIEGTECDIAGATPAQMDACKADVKDERNKRGGHIQLLSMKMDGMPMPMAPVARLDSVELTHMGRLTEMGHYPIHWHHVGDAQGDYIKNSSIHHSFQRCVTIHGTNNVTVDNNVCYDHFGHGFFLEDGDERNNTFANNLGFTGRRPPIFTKNGVTINRGLLQSDNHDTGSRWKTPATYWISNPENTFVDNVAAGSVGSGFWFAFVDQIACKEMGSMECRTIVPGSPAVQPDETRYFPNSAPLQHFEGNLAHTTGAAFTTGPAAVGRPTTPVESNRTCSASDGVCDRVISDSSYYTPRASGGGAFPYKPGAGLACSAQATCAPYGLNCTGGLCMEDRGAVVPPTYSSVVAYRNKGAGFYFRGGVIAEIGDSVMAENWFSAFFTYQQVLHNSLLVGLGPNLTDAAVLGQMDNVEMYGSRIYDGPHHFSNVHYAGFKSATPVVNGKTYHLAAKGIRLVGGAARATSNLTDKISFADSTDDMRVDMDYKDGTNVWLDSWSAAIIDLDGSLIGNAAKAGWSVLPGTALGSNTINAYPGCEYKAAWHAWLCPFKVGNFTVDSPAFLHNPALDDIHFHLSRIHRNAASQEVEDAYFDYAETNAEVVGLGGPIPLNYNSKLATPAYPAGHVYDFFTNGADHAFVLTLPALDASAVCTLAAPCRVSASWRFVAQNTTSSMLRIKLPPGSALKAVNGLTKVANEAALKDLTNINVGAWCDNGNGSISVRFKATQRTITTDLGTYDWSSFWSFDLYE